MVTTPSMEDRDQTRGLLAMLREGGLPLGVILTIGLVARIVRLNSSYWTDEILALQKSFRLSLPQVVTTFLGDTHHPLYSIFARLSLVTFGEAPWAIRLPAVLFGVMAVAMTYVVARLAVSRREALFASLLLAVSYHHVWFSQNARGYTLIGLLALLSTWTLIRLLHRPTWRLAAAYALCAALGAYTHLTMVFVAIGQALVAVVALARAPARIDWRFAVAAFAGAAAVTVLLYAPMLGQVVDFFVNQPSDLRGTSTPSWALGEAVRVLLTGINPSPVIAALILVAGAVIGIAGFAAIFRSSHDVALAIALPPLAVLAGALIGRGTMYPRFFFFAAGSAVIVFVRGVFAINEFFARRFSHLSAPAPAIIATALVALFSTLTLSVNYRYPKQDFPGAMRYVIAEKAPGDVVGFAGVPGDPYKSIFGQDWPTVETTAQVDSLRSRGRVWLIYTFPRYLRVGAPEVAAIVSRECRERAVFRGTVGGGDMIICTFEPS